MDKKGQEFGIAVVIFFIVLGVGIIVAFLGFDQVTANHLGVKVRLGQVTGTMGAGVQWTGILTGVEQYDMRIRQAKVEMLGDQSATDRDGQAVYGAVSVNYRVKQDQQVVQELFKNVGEDKDIARVLNLEPIIREGFKQASVEYEAIEILQNRQEVKEKAKENIRHNFPSEYFEIVDIVVDNIDFSPEFKNAIEEKKVASQNKLKEEEQVQVVKFQQQQEIEVYKAEAEKLRLQKQQVTDQLNTQLMLNKWNGQLPSYLIITDDSQGMFLQLAKGDIGTGDNENYDVDEDYDVIDNINDILEKDVVLKDYQGEQK